MSCRRERYVPTQLPSCTSNKQASWNVWPQLNWSSRAWPPSWKDVRRQIQHSGIWPNYFYVFVSPNVNLFWVQGGQGYTSHCELLDTIGIYLQYCGSKSSACFHRECLHLIMSSQGPMSFIIPAGWANQAFNVWKCLELNHDSGMRFPCYKFYGPLGWGSIGSIPPSNLGMKTPLQLTLVKSLNSKPQITPFLGTCWLTSCPPPGAKLGQAS